MNFLYMLLATTWMNFEDILNKISQTEKGKYYMIPLIQSTYSYEVYEDKRTVVLDRWLSHYDHLIFFQMTQVQFPASMLGSSKLSVTLSIGDPMLSSGFHGYIYKSGMHSHRHTDKPKTKDF